MGNVKACLDKKGLEELLLSGLTVKDIAKKKDKSEQWIYHLIKRHGISKTWR